MNDSIVAFAHALGIGLSYQDTEKQAAFLIALRTSLKDIPLRLQRGSSHEEIAYHWFSGSLIVSAPFEDGQQLIGFLQAVSAVQATFALNGIFLRGGVARGNHHHAEHVDYGPALIEAMGLEKQTGDSVRIVLSSQVRSDLALLQTRQPEIPVIVDGSDSAYFLDFLGCADGPARRNIRKHLERKYSELPNQRALINVRKKLRWMAAYYNWKTIPEHEIKYALDVRFAEYKP